MLLDIVGWVGNLILAPAVLFQIFTNWQRKSTEGVSRLSYLSIFLGEGMLAIVAWLGSAPFSVWAHFTFGALTAAFVLFQMWWYHSRA